MRKLCDWLKTPVRVVIGYWCIWVFLIGLEFCCVCVDDMGWGRLWGCSEVVCEGHGALGARNANKGVGMVCQGST